MEKKYIIEKIDIFVFIVGVILTIIDEMKKIPFYKLGLAMVMFLVLYVFPLILIIRFLKNPRKGEGFASLRAKGNSMTISCIFGADAGFVAISKECWSIPSCLVAVMIFLVCMELLNRYLYNKIRQTAIDEETKDKKDGAQGIISLYFALCFCFTYFVLKRGVVFLIL